MKNFQYSVAVSSARKIRVTFDQGLTLVEHVTAIFKTCYNNSYIIRDSLSQKDAEISVSQKSLISSTLNSCNSFIDGSPQSLIGRFSRKHDHITPTLKQLHWLPVYSCIKYKILLLTFKALHRLALSYITDMLQPCKPSRSL